MIRRCALPWLMIALAGCLNAKPFEDVDLGPDLAQPADLSMPDLMSCPSPCMTEGGMQCMGTAVRVCMRVGGCLSWADPVDCGADRLCCANACVDVDVTRCYACGIACGSDTPTCSPSLKRCACTPTSCAAGHKDCDAVSGGCVTCSPPPMPEARSDFFVDGATTVVSTGSQGCPYKTIAAAMTAALTSSAAQKTIHIAGGTYSTASGETFPLLLRSGISLIGAGAASTTITGDGMWDGSVQHSQLDSVHPVTVVVGSDGGATNTISNLTLTPTTMPGAYGVWCDRGNAPPIANPVAPNFPAANVTLKGVTVGPGYDLGIIDTNSTPTDTMVDSGCNLLVLGSTFTGDSAAAWALGCGINHTSTSGHTVAIQYGDNTMSGVNTFTGLHNAGSGAYPSGGNNGAALHAWDCVSPVRVLKNKFDDLDGALIFAMHSRLHVIDIENNSMTNLSNYGVLLAFNDMQLDQFIGNTLSGIGEGASLPAANAPFSHPALGVGATGQVMKARNNVFSGNYVGVEIVGSGMGGTRSVIDFGTAADPGGNTFTCNSHASATPGYDVWVHLSSASDPALTLGFAGNTWNRDNVTPGAGGTDGADLVVTSSSGAAAVVDHSAQKTSMGTCTGGRVP